MKKSIVAKVPVVDESEQLALSEEPVETDEAPQNLALKKSSLDEGIPVVKPAPQQTVDLEARPAMGGMRWPVKGKIISEYGAKPNGLKNEGINIAVPEGTGVRAAESGVLPMPVNQRLWQPRAHPP
jgi:murein DD-endopeptidase MepM/ murein hydrolase activator NlpD